MWPHYKKMKLLMPVKNEAYRVNRYRKLVPLNYVSWNRWGVKQKSSAPASTVPNVVVQGPPGIERFSVPVTCKSGKHSVADSLEDSSGFRLPPLSIIRGIGNSDESPPSCISAPAVQEDINANAEENDGDEDEDTDSDDEDDHGWVNCRGRHCECTTFRGMLMPQRALDTLFMFPELT